MLYILLIISLLISPNVFASASAPNAFIIGDQSNFSLTNGEGLPQICLSGVPLSLADNVNYVVNQTNTTFSLIVIGESQGTYALRSNITTPNSVICVPFTASGVLVTSITLYTGTETLTSSYTIINPPGKVNIPGANGSTTILITQDSNGQYHIEAIQSTNTNNILVNV
ncbi:MAG TPA: hypothetical protein VHA52_01240 [Candidatus Babeliaceae bacterium]|nr:hypothetical protein [Candidatus Babeliaceae bacterium]